MVHGEPDAQQALRAELKKLNITVNLLIDRRLPASLYAYSMLICGTPSEFLLEFDKEMIMSASEIFKIIRQNKEKLSQLGVRQIGLFGSQSRGDATPDSDLDFLVEFIKGRKNYDNYIELCFFLEDLFSKKIDLLTPESLSPHLKEQILREVQYETIH